MNLKLTGRASSSGQDLTMTDAVGLHIMVERKVKSCWSTDFHLGLTGIPLIIHQH